MTLIRKSMKAIGPMAGMLALGSALAPFASAAWLICFGYGGRLYCFIVQ